MNKLSKEQFKEIFDKVPRLCAELIIIQDNKILLTLRDIEPARNQWHLPGGTIFYKESVMDALHRIAKEEINVSIEIIKFLGYIDWETNKNAYGHSISLDFLVKIRDGVIKTDFQAKKAQFFDKLPENTIEENKNFILKNLSQFNSL